MIAEPHRDLFTRDEHLTMLTVERYRVGELRPGERDALTRHIDQCRACRDAVSSALDVVSLPVARARRTRRWAGAAIAAGLAAAAALALLATRGEPDHAASEIRGDGIRLKGSAFAVQVHVHDGVSSRRAQLGEVVHPGDRLGFVVRGLETGHLLIVGTDDGGNTYACHPGDGVSERVIADDGAWTYTTRSAVRVDDTLGHEHILGVLCDAPVTAKQLQPALAQLAAGKPVTTIPDGCAHRVVVLSKEGSPR